MSQIEFLGDPIFTQNDSNGVPLSGGLLWCYAAGTDNLKDMYATISDAVQVINALPNPVILNSLGAASIVYAGASKFVLENAEIDPVTGHGVQQWVADNVGRFGNSVIDPNGNMIVDYNYVENADNYIEIDNVISGNNPTITAEGADDNIGINLVVKGTTKGVTFKSDAGALTLNLETPGTSGYVLTSDDTGELTLQAPLGLSDLIPPGFVMDFAGTSVPTGWLAFSNTPVSRVTYAALYAAIGTTWGVGDGSNTFNLPPPRVVRVAAGGTTTATLGNAVGSKGGTEDVAITAAQLAAHNHPASATPVGDHQHSVANAGLVAASDNKAFGTAGTTLTGGAGAHGHTITVSDNIGGGQAHNNMQPSAVFLSCIKT